MKKHNSSSQKTIFKRFTPTKFTLLYAVIAALWIVASGKLLSFIIDDDVILQEHIELAKGLVFVAVTSGLLYLLLKKWRRTEDKAMDIQEDAVMPISRLMLLFTAMVLVVPLAGLAITTLYSSQLEREAYANLEAIAKLKAEQIENWLGERQSDSTVLMSRDGLIKHIEQFVQKPTVFSNEAIQKLFEILRTSYDYESILLISLDGRILFSSGENIDMPVDFQRLLNQSLANKQGERGNFYRDAAGNVHLDWVVPVFVTDTQGEHAIASVVLRTTAQRFLFPLIQTWPTSSPSAETLLVQRDGEFVLFLNTLRHRNDTAMSLRLPLNHPEFPAAKAILSGKPGTIKGFDYRNVEVLSAYRPIKNTNWYLIAKIDRNEVLAPLYKLVLSVSLIAFIAIVAISTTLLMLWQQQQKARNLILRVQQAKLEAALASMSDAVYISDTEGQFVEFNEAFATFHKFKNKEECPKTLSEYPDLFDVYSTSGDFIPLEQRPVTRALRGEISTNTELTLRRRDTGETWIGSYNYAPIRNNNGVIVGTVITARDITERKKTEASLRESEEKLRLFIHYSPSAIAMFDRDMRYIAYSYHWLIDYGLGEQELTGRSHYDVFPDIPARWKEVHQRCLNGAVEKCDQDPFLRADGSVAWVRWEIHPWLTSEGDIGGIIMFSEVITERKNMEDALVASEKEFRSLAESMPQIVWITRADGWNIYFNQQWVDYTGLSLEESYGHGWMKPFHPDDQKRVWDTWQNTVNVNNHANYSLECQLRRADGIYRWWLIRGSPIFDEHGKVFKWFGTCTDIHDIKEAEKVLREKERLLADSQAIAHVGSWMMDISTGMINWSEETFRLYGLSPETDKTPTVEQFLELLHPDDRLRMKDWLEDCASGKQPAGLEFHTYPVNGNSRCLFRNGVLETDQNGKPLRMIGTVQDITERKKAEEIIYDLAYYDPLTRLPNRRLMLDRLKQALISHKLKSRYGAILFMDLNDFKTLNDIKGHDIGDLLLIKVSRHLQAAVHEDDTVARTSGNEFVVLLDTLDKATDLAASQAEIVAQKLLMSISQPFDLQGYEYRCTASIGIALFHSHEITADELIKHADMAVHQAKETGKNTICFFDPAVQAALESRVQLESWMRKALDGQYSLYFQIQIDNDYKATGVEALIRWYHPKQGMISPAAFIPLAEQTGLILPIGQWVLETACAQLKAWEHNQNTQHLILAVNVSAKQFNQPDFVQQVLTVLDKTGVSPDRLKLELTESMLVNNVEDIIVKMNALRNKGVRFSLDDFGTGFSSLSYLKRLPLDQLKIDQSFVRDALTDPNDAAIIRTIIALGQSLGIEVIAEGVETEEQRNFLANHGCKYYQGYLFSKPLPLKEFEQLFASSNIAKAQ